MKSALKAILCNEKGSAIVGVIVATVFLGVVAGAMLKSTTGQSAASRGYTGAAMTHSTVSSALIATESWFANAANQITALNFLNSHFQANIGPDTAPPPSGFIPGNNPLGGSNNNPRNKKELASDQFFNSELITFHSTGGYRGEFLVRSGRTQNGRNLGEARGFYRFNNLTAGGDTPFGAQNAIYLGGNMAVGNQGMEVYGNATFSGKFESQDGKPTVFKAHPTYGGNVFFNEAASFRTTSPKFEVDAYFRSDVFFQMSQIPVFDKNVGFNGNLAATAGNINFNGDSVWLNGNFWEIGAPGAAQFQDRLRLTGSGEAGTSFNYTDSLRVCNFPTEIGLNGLPRTTRAIIPAANLNNTGPGTAGWRWVTAGTQMPPGAPMPTSGWIPTQNGLPWLWGDNGWFNQALNNMNIYWNPSRTPPVPPLPGTAAGMRWEREADIGAPPNMSISAIPSSSSCGTWGRSFANACIIREIDVPAGLCYPTDQGRCRIHNTANVFQNEPDHSPSSSNLNQARRSDGRIDLNYRITGFEGINKKPTSGPYEDILSRLRMVEWPDSINAAGNVVVPAHDPQRVLESRQEPVIDISGLEAGLFRWADLPAGFTGLVGGTQYNNLNTFGTELDKFIKLARNDPKYAGNFYNDHFMIHVTSHVNINGGEFAEKVIFVVDNGGQITAPNGNFYNSVGDNASTLIYVKGNGRLETFGVPANKTFRGLIYTDVESTNTQNFLWGNNSEIQGAVLLNSPTSNLTWNTGNGTPQRSVQIHFNPDVLMAFGSLVVGAPPGGGLVNVGPGVEMEPVGYYFR